MRGFYLFSFAGEHDVEQPTPEQIERLKAVMGLEGEPELYELAED